MYWQFLFFQIMAFCEIHLPLIWFSLIFLVSLAYRVLVQFWPLIELGSDWPTNSTMPPLLVVSYVVITIQKSCIHTKVILGGHWWLQWMRSTWCFEELWRSWWWLYLGNIFLCCGYEDKENEVVFKYLTVIWQISDAGGYYYTRYNCFACCNFVQ